jgi:hypothetical protein
MGVTIDGTFVAQCAKEKENEKRGNSFGKIGFSRMDGSLVEICAWWIT